MPPKFSFEDESAFLYIHPTITLRRPPCQAVCPAGIPVSLMNRLIAQKKTREALHVLLDVTPFPEWLCGECGRPCEKACNRGHLNQTAGPIPIARLERHAASWLPDATPPRAVPSGRKIAVLGRNTTGLAAAYFLCRLGHGVTIMGNEKEFEESCASAEARDALERVQRYLSDCGAVFAEPIPAPETASAGFDAVIFCSGMDKAEHAISGERKGGSSGISLPGVAGRHSLLVSCGSGREAPLFVLTEKSSSPAAATAAARLAASAADTVLAGSSPERLAWLRILSDGTVEREMLPVNMPEDLKPVTTVRAEDLCNPSYFAGYPAFREQLSSLESLEEQAMGCFHCGKCIGCGICVSVCPGDVLEMENDRPLVRYPDECIHCAACMLDCPSSAIFFRLPLPATLGAPMKYLA